MKIEKLTEILNKAYAEEGQELYETTFEEIDEDEYEHVDYIEAHYLALKNVLNKMGEVVRLKDDD